jgi:hypothetical protein
MHYSCRSVAIIGSLKTLSTDQWQKMSKGGAAALAGNFLPLLVQFFAAYK